MEKTKLQHFYIHYKLCQALHPLEQAVLLFIRPRRVYNSSHSEVYTDNLFLYSMKIGVFQLRLRSARRRAQAQCKALFDTMKERYTDHEFLLFSPSANAPKNVPKSPGSGGKRRGVAPCSRSASIPPSLGS